MTVAVVVEGALAFVAGWMGCSAWGVYSLAKRGVSVQDVVDALDRLGRR